MRFCMLTTFYPPWSFGGDAVHVRRLSQALTRRGHDVTVIHSLGGYRALGGRAPAARDRDGAVRLVAIDAPSRALASALTHVSGRPALFRRQLRRALDRPFDVLHFHNPSLLGGPALLSMGQGLRVYTLHEQWLVCPTHVLFRYQREICVKRHCLTCQLAYRRPPQLWRATGLLDREVASLDALIAPSRTSAELHQRFSDMVRIEQIPHFVESIDAKLPTGPDRDGGYFLCVGRLEPVKGFARAIDAFAGRTERLVIVGTGTLERALRRRAAGLPNVQFGGYLDQAELAELYRGARAVIVPSAGHEAFGLVAVEAFSHGTPVIVPRFGALRELVEESGGGLTYGNDRELGEAVSQLATDDSVRAALGARGQKAAQQRWSEEAHLERYFALIAELATARGNRELAARAA